MWSVTTQTNQRLDDLATSLPPLLFINCPSADTQGFLGAPTGLYYAVGPLVEAIRKRELRLPEISRSNFYDPQSAYELEKELTSKLLDLRPAIVGISQTSEAHHIALRMATIIRAVCQDRALIVFGGPHEDEVSFRAKSLQHTLAKFPDLVDVVVSGDGEYALLQIVKVLSTNLGAPNSQKIRALLDRADEFRAVEGRGAIFVKTNAEVCELSLSGEPVKLDHLPTLHYELMERRHLYNYDVFKRPNGTIKKCAQLMSHRGCRSACVYCTERGSFSGKSVEKLISEIRVLRETQNIEAVFFDDSTFNEDNDFVRKFCESIIAEKIHLWLEWGCLTRFDSINPDVLRVMKEAGCTYCYFGLEQYDTATLRNIGKATSESTILTALREMEKAEIRVGVSLLFGIGESWEVAQKTLSFVREWVERGTIAVVSISANCYHPNSAMTRRDKVMGRIDYGGEPPHAGHPWNCFEEGMWFHPDSFTEDYAWQVVKLVRASLNPTVLVRQKLIDCALGRTDSCAECVLLEGCTSDPITSERREGILQSSGR